MAVYLKISELPAASSVAPTDQIELNQAGTSRSATVGLAVGVYQTVLFQTGALGTGTGVIPADDTIPQNTEGTEFMNLAITPKSATSKLVIDVVWSGSPSALVTMVAALFQDSDANALAAVTSTAAAPNYLVNMHLTHSMTSGSTSARTFRVRVGGTSACTTTINGQASTRWFGGVMASSISIQEVAV